MNLNLNQGDEMNDDSKLIAGNTCTLPEPSAWLGLLAGACLLALISAKRSPTP